MAQRFSTQIGCDKVHVAFLDETTDSPTSLISALKYTSTPGSGGTVGTMPLVGTVNLNITTNASQETLFADDGPFESATTSGPYEVELERAYLTSEEQALLLGHSFDSTNYVVASSSSDIAPYVALGFRTLKANGTYRYVWLYKGRFSEPDDSNATKGDSISWGTKTITAQFVQTKALQSTGGVPIWKQELDEGATDTTIPAVATWFTQVYGTMAAPSP